MPLKKSNYIHLGIMLILAFGISAMHPIGSITPFGMKAIAAFISVLYGWIFFDLFWSSLFGFMIIPILGLNTVADTLAIGIGNSMVTNVLFSMAFAIAVDLAGVTDVLANWLLQRKILRKSPWFLIIGLLLVGSIIGIMGPSMAAIFLLWSITMKIADYCDIKKGEPMLSFLLMMIPVFTMTATFILPFRGGVLVFIAYLMQVTDVVIPASRFITYGIIMIGSIFTLILFAAKFILKLDASKFMLPEQVIKEISSVKTTKKHKMALVVLVGYSVILLVASLFTSLPGAVFINKLGVGGVSAIGVLVLAVLSYEGNGLVRIQNIFAKIDWSLIYLLAVTYPIADLIKSPDAGVMPSIMAVIGPIVMNMGAIPFMIVSMLILGAITQFTHNIVLAAMFMPFLLPLCEAAGGNMYTLWFMLFLVLNMAYCTPAGSMQSALVFGHEIMVRKHAYTYGICLLVITWIVCGLVGIPLGNLLFGGLA